MSEIVPALQGRQEVVIDLSEVVRIDTAAIQALLSAQKEADFLGVTLTLLQSAIVKDFALTIGVSL